MKYINREYGFTGRPPYFKDFYEEAERGPVLSPDNYPGRSVAGGGLDRATPYGALLVGAKGTRWIIGMSFNIRGRWIDAGNCIDDFGSLYAASEDGNFTYFSYGDLTASVVKYSAGALVLSIAAMYNVKVRLKFAPDEAMEAEMRREEATVKAAATPMASIAGEVSSDGGYSVYRGRYEVVASPKEKEYFTAKVYKTPDSVSEEGGAVVMEYGLQGSDSRLFIYAAVGGKEIFSLYPEEAELSEGVSMEEIAYSVNKAFGRGVLGRNLGGFINSSMYHRIYNPYLLGCVYIESRSACDKYFAFRDRNTGAAAIIAAYLNDFSASARQLANVPGEMHLAPMALNMLFCRSRDTGYVKRLYEAFSGKYIPEGSLAISEDGNKLKYYDVGLSSLKLIAMDVMERAAIIAGAPESSLYAAAKSRLKAEINRRLWNPKLGLYMDKEYDGDFLANIRTECFLPMAAGAVDGLDKLEKLIVNLKDPKKFYGKRMLPAIAKDAPGFGEDYSVALPGGGEEKHIRGEIAPWLNYLIYMGLVRCGVYDLQSELAISSAGIWNNRYGRGKFEVLDRYSPYRSIRLDRKTLKPIAEKIAENAERHSLSGNLMALIGVSELIDAEYFRDDFNAAIRFGTAGGGLNKAANVRLFGRSFSVQTSERELSLAVSGVEVFRCEGGRSAVRNFTENSEGCEFILYAGNEVALSLTLPVIGLCKEGSRVMFNAEKGCSRVRVVNGRPKITKIS